MNVQEVIEVEKTVSPKMLWGAPNERPLKDCPVFRCRTAGSMVDVEGAWLAKPREEWAIRVKLRTNMMLVEKLLLIEERENEIAEVAVGARQYACTLYCGPSSP